MGTPRPRLVAILPLWLALSLAACAGASAPPPAPVVCAATLRVEVTNNAGTSVEVWWEDEGTRIYLGTAVPGVSTLVTVRQTGNPRFEQGGRLITGRLASQLSYRLFCM